MYEPEESGRARAPRGAPRCVPRHVARCTNEGECASVSGEASTRHGAAPPTHSVRDGGVSVAVGARYTSNLASVYNQYLGADPACNVWSFRVVQEL